MIKKKKQYVCDRVSDHPLLLYFLLLMVRRMEDLKPIQNQVASLSCTVPNSCEMFRRAKMLARVREKLSPVEALRAK